MTKDEQITFLKGRLRVAQHNRQFMAGLAKFISQKFLNLTDLTGVVSADASCNKAEDLIKLAEHAETNEFEEFTEEFIKEN